MNKDLLQKHIKKYQQEEAANPDQFQEDWSERQEHITKYQGYDEATIHAMDEEDIYEYISPLWAMQIWGNKRYVTDNLIEDNGLEYLKEQLVSLLWSDGPIEDRWDSFRKNIKGMGPAMISEILCKTHPDQYIVWNRRAQIGLDYLGVEDLPRYDYQLDGQKYRELCEIEKEMASELARAGFEETSLLMVDYFIWHELQVEETLSKRSGKGKEPSESDDELEQDSSKFIHNDVRDKIRNIGQWLGFEANIERRVAAGSQVDTVWESTIGNMGRVIYVFEVQTKGSIDSLIVNLLKSLNNPAVQGVVAVSNNKQLEKIKSHAEGVTGLRDKLKLWDYQEVLNVHEKLEYVNESINQLDLVPDSF
ncbi:hypothetical protein [Halalkalibaculum sp. DA384]|uniref:hypothetical protein n=1 Tax=Halalkalibaculum sp. DA384 TaxID=3373606 RepID=UPI003754B905